MPRSVTAFAVLACLGVVDRAGDIVHLRGLSVVRTAAAVVVALGAASGAWVASEYGPWSAFALVRRLQRDAALALVALALVVALDSVAAAFS